MAWDKGFNFRATSGYVTDGTDETYCLYETYPVTRNSVTFGWNAGPTAGGGADRNTTYAKLAGINFDINTQPRTFRVDLPAAGDYAIRIAMGDTWVSGLIGQFVIKDDSSVLFTSTDYAQDIGGDDVIDATDARRTSAADWIANNAANTLTFATTICNITFQSPANSAYWVATHVFISQVGGAAAGQPTMRRWGGVPFLGGGRGWN